jgi:3-hydroxybutyrate dehydrogenase
MFKNKVVIITGSTSGIGLGIARYFAQNHACVCINGFGSPESIHQTLEELSCASANKENIMYHGADMTSVKDIDSMVEEVLKRFGSLDILINNAGIQYVSPIEDFPIDKYEAIIATNLSAAFYSTRKVIPHMKSQNWGRIINIASAHALVASPFKSAYVAAKHGLLGLTKTVALESAEFGITCNAVCPGYTLTPLVEGQIKDTALARNISEELIVRDVLLAAQPNKKFIKIDEVVSLVGYLASNAADSITGASLSIDGGWTAH